MKFDLDYFKNNNVVINCESEKESKELFRILKEYGINEWADSNELNINNTYWDMYKNDTCYEIEFGKSLTYTDCWYYKEEAFDDYEIIKFKDIDFKRSDIKMIIKQVKLSNMIKEMEKYLEENGDKVVSSIGTCNGYEDGTLFKLYLSPLYDPYSCDRDELNIKRTEL